ncbi:MAG: hypothetical protein IT259_02810 [Saprospiraceae bacterium]|nr:hypothetical protein [Saprospiraceae bacterium]
MRTLFIAVALLAFMPSMSACDVCGCSIGGNYFGILPQFHRHFIGLRWSEQQFNSSHTRAALLAGDDVTDEQFRTIDLLARFYPWQRVQILALAPYHDFQRTEHGLPIHTQGIGDVSVLANYIVFDSGDSLRRSWRHTLTLGGGLKLPTGKHTLYNTEGELIHPNMQPGTGSTDFMISAAYTLRKGAWGLSTDGIARLNTANNDEYRFGNRLSGSAKIFYWNKIGPFTLLPNLGVFSDYAQPNRDKGETVDNTGGLVTLATSGLEVYTGRFSIGFTYQIPVYENLGDGAIDARNRWMATINYIF